jgi:hypothetical protein
MQKRKYYDKRELLNSEQNKVDRHAGVALFPTEQEYANAVDAATQLKDRKQKSHAKTTAMTRMFPQALPD